MVDLQPISDLHKSEVYALAKLLEIPQDIIDAPPAGDVYDGRVDEEMIGAPYWFVELYLLYLSAQDESLLQTLSDEERQQFEHYQANLEELHRKNAHKYWVGSPAVHLDVYERFVPGGWQS